MKKIQSVKTILMIIGSLSIISGIYLAIKGGESNQVFNGIILGVTLIGSAYFYNNDELKTQHEEDI